MVSKKQTKLLRINWKDVLGNNWNGLCLIGDGTIERIIASGGTVIKTVVVE